MLELLSILPGRKKTSPSGWVSFNAICCVHKGHRPDTKMRGGVLITGNTQTYHCFNCGFKCSFVFGKTIGYNTRKLLTWCGLDEEQIQKYNLESLQNKDIFDFTTQQPKTKLKFQEKDLPKGELLNANNRFHQKYIKYLKDRHINYESYPFMVNLEHYNKKSDGIIIPFTYQNKVVGSTIRFLQNNKQKYLNDSQQGYVFGIDFQKKDYSVCILTEGIFDALSIDGCALMHNTISDDQALLLSQLYKKIIMVPDRDKAGLDIIERALELGYSVSLPNWDSSVKDVNDAVIKYGKLFTILSILQANTSSRIKLEIQRKKILKETKL